uniref:Spermatogenesis associated 17 n=1 Tax=Strigops habroptila TaxID=2489341 RepID=A0A672VE57_STRHB
TASLGTLCQRLILLLYVFRSLDEERKIEYKAAIKIQSWFRGCRVRAYLRYLNQMVIIIQRWWRGYLGRKHFRRMVKVRN